MKILQAAAADVSLVSNYVAALLLTLDLSAFTNICHQTIICQLVEALFVPKEVFFIISVYLTRVYHIFYSSINGCNLRYEIL